MIVKMRLSLNDKRKHLLASEIDKKSEQSLHITEPQTRQ